MPPGTRAWPCCRWWGGKPICYLFFIWPMSRNRWFILVCCFLTTTRLFHLHELLYEDSVSDFLIELVEALLAVGLFFIACFRIYKRTDLEITKRLTPIYLWVSSAVLVATYNYSINRIKNAPDFLRIISGHFGYQEFSLKEDGRYIYENASFLSSTYNYGTYTRRDSVIILLPNTPRNAPQQLKLIIRPYNASSRPAFNKQSLVFAINKNGEPRRFDSGYQGHRIVELADE